MAPFTKILVGARDGVALGAWRASSFALVGVALSVALASGGCDWRKFDSDAKNAPVRSIGAPDSFQSKDFGQSVLPLSSGQDGAAAFVATSLQDTNVTIVKLTAAGDVSTSTVGDSQVIDLEESEVTSVAELPGTTASSLGLLLGTPRVHNATFGRTWKLALPTGSATALPVMESGFGRGIAVGFVTGDSALADYVIGSDDRLIAFADGDTTTAITYPGGDAIGCTVQVDLQQDARYLLRRAITTAKLWDGATTEQIVSGATPPGGTGGVVSFFGVDAGALTCLAAIQAPAGVTGTHFGYAVTTGDFNGDGVTDLLVGAPPHGAVVYLGPFPAGLASGLVISDGGAGIDFGYSVAALNVDGAAGDEALVGDPRATVDGQAYAGQVTAYRYDSGSNQMVAVAGKTYSDHAPESEAVFGTSINALRFCAKDTPCSAAADFSRVLMIGAGNEVFVYFREGDNIPERASGDTTVRDVRAR
jgi:hypothetical protein